MAYYDETSEVARITILMGVVVALIVFILVDVSKALMRRAHWIPGDLLVLSALTIQLLNLLSGQSGLLKEAMDNPKKLGTHNIIKNELWLIHSRRLMLCVAVAYMLPGMACRGSENSWGKLLALVITIFSNIIWDLYIVHRLAGHSKYWPQAKNTGQAVFIASAFIVSLGLIALTFLLGCANIASRGVEVVIAQKIPLLLSKTPDSGADQEKEEEEWRTVEDEVLRSSIVGRAYSPEYIMARSPLTSSAAAIVTVQIATSIGGWAVLSGTVPLHGVFALTVLQRAFVLLGWAVIGWRWAASVAYYQRWKSDTWRSAFLVEDFWTRHIREMMEANKPQLLPKKRLQKKVKKLMAKEPKDLKTPRCLLYVLLVLQWLVVLCSKVCWIVSLMVFQNKCMKKIMSLLLNHHEKKVFKDYPEYENILKGLEMLGETSKSLWVANRKSIADARNLVVQGQWDGEHNCQDLIEFLAQKRTPECESQKDLKYLYKLRSQVQPLDVEKHFVEASKRSWKMEVVTLIKIFFHLSPFNVEDKDGTCSTYQMSSQKAVKDKAKAASPSQKFLPKAVEDLSKAYSQAWEIIDFIEETELEADSIMSEAADTLFFSLQTEIEQNSLPTEECRHTHCQECVAAAIDELAEESKKQTESRGIIMSAIFCKFELKNKNEKLAGKEMPAEDSMNWRKAAAGNALYKLCKSIDCSTIGTYTDVKELLDEIERKVADIIYDCLNKVQNASVVNSKKWARESKENKIGRALYTVGKARVVTRKLRRGFYTDPCANVVLI